MTPKFKTFVCDNCGGTFDSDWPDEEARAEQAEHFPGMSNESMVEVCDECYKAIMNWAEGQSDESI